MSKKIHKITRNLMMITLSLSLLLGLGFVLDTGAEASGRVRLESAGDVANFLAATLATHPSGTVGYLHPANTANFTVADNGDMDILTHRIIDLNGGTLVLNRSAIGTGPLSVEGSGNLTIGASVAPSGLVTIGERVSVNVGSAGILGGGAVTLKGAPGMVPTLNVTAGGRVGTGTGTVTLDGLRNVTLPSGAFLGQASVVLNDLGNVNPWWGGTVGGDGSTHTLTLRGNTSVTAGSAGQIGRSGVALEGSGTFTVPADAFIGGANSDVSIGGTSTVVLAAAASLGTGGTTTVGTGATLRVGASPFNIAGALVLESSSNIESSIAHAVVSATGGLANRGANTTGGTGPVFLVETVTPVGPTAPLFVPQGQVVPVRADDLINRTRDIVIDGGTLQIVGITGAGTPQVIGSMGDEGADPAIPPGFDIVLTPRGGTIDLVREVSTVPGVLELGPNVTIGNQHRSLVGRPLRITGNSDLSGWRTSTLRHFFGTITLDNGAGMITAPYADTGNHFWLEDGKSIDVRSTARLSTHAGGRFYLGTPTNNVPGSAGITNAGTIALGNDLVIVGRSTLDNSGRINLIGNNLIVAGSNIALTEGASLVNTGTGENGIRGVGSIIVQGGSGVAGARSGSFVNAGLVTDTVDLRIERSYHAGVVGGSVVNDGTMNLRDVTVQGGGTPDPGGTTGQGGTLENNATLDISGTWTVGRATGATSTAGTLNNDGTLRLGELSSGTVVGGNAANVDAGVLTNSEDANMYLRGELTLVGSSGHADAGAVEFTNEGALTVYNWPGNGPALLTIGAGLGGAPSAQMINEGSLQLGSDQRWNQSGGFIWFAERSGAGTRATFVNDGVVDVQGSSWIGVESSVRPVIGQLGLFQNTADGLIRVTADHGWNNSNHYLPTGTFENAGIVTFTANASELTTPATDVFGNGIAIGVGPYNWPDGNVIRGALPFAGLGHRQILSVYGNGGRFGVGLLSTAGFNEIHMTAGEDRLVNISVLDNFDLLPTRGTERLVGFNTQRDGSGVFFEVDEPVEVIGTLQPGQPNPDVIWAQWAAPTPGISFGDVSEGRFYAAAVRWAANTDPAIARGFQGTNQFRPYANLTRGQFVTMLYRLAGEPSVANLSHPFTDVGAGRFYENAIIWAFNHDVITGFSGTTQFRPNVPIQRQHVATTLYRMANASPAPANALHGFPDVSDISPYAVNAVNWAVSNGIMGRATGTLRPLDRIDRGEAVTMIFRAAVERGLIP